jgi:flavorubredoxin
MDKIDGLGMEMICTSHGPILRTNPERYIELYREWSSDALKTREGKTVSILYVSAYGNTKLIGELLKDRIESAGIKVNLYDISEEDLDMLINLVDNSDALLVGSPTINQDAVKPVWDLLSLVSPIANRGKIGGAFGSFGWSGEAVGMLQDRLKGLKFKIVDPGMKVNFVPSDEDKKSIIEYADRMIEAIK